MKGDETDKMATKKKKLGRVGGAVSGEDFID